MQRNFGIVRDYFKQHSTTPAAFNDIMKNQAQAQDLAGQGLMRCFSNICIYIYIYIYIYCSYIYVNIYIYTDTTRIYTCMYSICQLFV